MIPRDALRDLRVVECATGIASAYCTKLFADAGADVVKLEPPGGDPLRRWSASGADLGHEDGALFRFLHAGKRSVVGAVGDHADLLAAADVVVEALPTVAFDRDALRRRAPGLVLVSITPFGRSGPWADRPASEFTIQAESGSIGVRGRPDQVPFQAGGRTSEWTAGSFAAVGALAAVWRSRRTGHGEHVDVSMLEAMSVASTAFLDLFWSLFGRPDVPGPARTMETPSIEPTADGWVGFCTNTGQQFRDFLVLIERDDLQGDPELPLAFGRQSRWAEWNAIVHAWTTRHTTAEIVERARALRIPVAPVCDGRTVVAHEHLHARGTFVRDASDRFTHPRSPFRFDGDDTPPAARPAPRLGEHTGRVAWSPVARPAPVGPPALPLAGVRVVDLTNWWAGPSATQALAALGADVIHVESTRKVDGARSAGGVFMGHEHWWEFSPFFLGANANKRDVTLDLSQPAGRDAMLRLIAAADIFVENYSPRVVEGFDLDWPTVHAANSRLVMVRLPAFGLSGPWRDAVGFAQTMEQLTGLAWLTGHADDQPRIQRGPCDPLSGMHAAVGALLGLMARERSGVGCHVEMGMVDAAMVAAAEAVIEHSAYGRLLSRDGNRSADAAPQGLYACRGTEQWLALSVTDERTWNGLRRTIGPELDDAAFATVAGRRARHDALDAIVGRWAATQDLATAVDALLAAGVPAGAVVDPRATSRHPQMTARGFYEAVAHPVVGTHPIPTLPFRYASVDRWVRTPAPTLGQHNREVLHTIAGLADDAIDRFLADGVIGDRPKGV